MINKTPVALKVTPEGIRAAIAAVPEVGEMHINEVLGGYLVLNVPHFNKDGSVSKRPSKKYVLLDRERFNARFAFAERQQKRAFVPVTLR